MKCSYYQEKSLISKALTKKETCNNAEDGATNGAAESDESGHRTDSGQRKDIRGQSHDEPGP